MKPSEAIRASKYILWIVLRRYGLPLEIVREARQMKLAHNFSREIIAFYLEKAGF